MRWVPSSADLLTRETREAKISSAFHLLEKITSRPQAIAPYAKDQRETLNDRNCSIAHSTRGSARHATSRIPKGVYDGAKENNILCSATDVH